MAMKNIIVGLGEIGNPILKLISKKEIAIGFDINPKLTDHKKLKKYEKLETSFLLFAYHIQKIFLKTLNLFIINLNRHP